MTSARTPISAAFSAALRVAMARANLSQQQLAQRANVSEGTVSNYYHGRQTPRMQELYAVARALGTTPTALWDSTLDELNSSQADQAVHETPHAATTEDQLGGSGEAGTGAAPHGPTIGRAGHRRTQPTKDRPTHSSS